MICSYNLYREFSLIYGAAGIYLDNLLPDVLRRLRSEKRGHAGKRDFLRFIKISEISITRAGFFILLHITDGWRIYFFLLIYAV